MEEVEPNTNHGLKPVKSNPVAYHKKKFDRIMQHRCDNKKGVRVPLTVTSFKIRPSVETGDKDKKLVPISKELMEKIKIKENQQTSDLDSYL